ncbi:MAG: hypothetical protein KDD25_10345, partial [Bdellovibrionales bacterium]|nr:hypothetical protein [Bdellovibrionales bacterium]
FHMALTTMDMGSGGEKGKFVGDTKVLSRNTANLKSKFSDLIRQGESGSSLERGIGAAAAALTEPLISSVNTGFLRLGSLLAIIFISNEDDHSSQSPEDLANLLDTIRPEGDFGRNWIVNYIGITEPDGYCRTSGNYSDPGDRYMDLVDFSNGVQENICEENLSPALSNLKKRIVSQLTQFKLKDNADEATIVVTNNGKKVKKNPENGWSYNSGKNAVAFHGSAIPSADDVIRIKYDILR